MDYIKLKDVCTINMGQSPDSDSYNENGNGVPFFQGNADFGERYPVTRKWCSAPTKMAAPEDILISVRAPIGAMNYANEECCIGRGLAALTPNREKVSPEYIFWLLKGKNAELNSKGTGSTFKAIGRNILEETLVPDISLEKQTECSIILEKTYKVISSRKQQLQKLDELVKARLRFHLF
jgi:type I restriction enzyme S subunit